MFKIRKTTTGTRPVSDVEELIVSVTSGNIKISMPAADKLKLGIGDRVSIAVDDEGVPCIAKTGSGDEGTGGKLAKAGSNLQFSDAGSYQELEGNNELNRHYDFDFDNPQVLSAEDGKQFGFEEETTWYSLTFRETSEAQKKGKRAEGGEEEEESED